MLLKHEACTDRIQYPRERNSDMKPPGPSIRSRTVRAWVVVPLTALIVLSPIALVLAMTRDTQWHDYLIPAALGGLLLLVMVYWLLYVRGVERRLEAERSLLRLLIDHLPDRVFIKDAAGRRILSNSADWQATGAASMEAVIGKSVSEIFPPDLAARYCADDQEILEKGQPILNREEPSLDSQGNPIWTLATEVPLRDENQKLIGIIGLIRDITAFKAATEAERRAEERYRVILEESVEGIYQSTPAGKLLTANPALAWHAAILLYGGHGRQYERPGAPDLRRPSSAPRRIPAGGRGYWHHCRLRVRSLLQGWRQGLDLGARAGGPRCNRRGSLLRGHDGGHYRAKSAPKRPSTKRKKNTGVSSRTPSLASSRPRSTAATLPPTRRWPRCSVTTARRS